MRREVQIARFWLNYCRVSQSLGSCAAIRSEALVTRMSRTVEHKQAQVYGLQVKPGTDASLLLAHIPTPSYYAGPEPVESQSSHPAMFYHIQSFFVKSINDISNKHTRPLWLQLSAANGGIIYQIECEIDSGAGCNVMPLYLHKSLFGDKEVLPTSVRIFSYGESPAANLGACTIAIHTGNSQDPQMATCQVTDTRGYLILGRETAQKVGYIAFIDRIPPSLTSTPQIHTSVNALRRKEKGSL